jgi:rhamnosyltransferase
LTDEKQEHPIDITIAILTYNGDKYIRQILKAIRNQDIDQSFEVLVIDSGSTDSTLDIIAEFPEVRLHQIPNSEFGHGRTRNLAAKMSRGDIVVYLTHDAVPSHKKWLYEMVQPFAINPKIVGVIGKQIPRRHCFPLLRYEIGHVFSGFGPDFGTTIFYKDEFIKKRAVYDAVTFYSDANSSVRRDLLLGEIPYQDVDYAEDQLLGRDIIERGLYKAYAPRASVRHSNDFKLREYRKRMFDETVALRKIGVIKWKLRRRAAIKRIIRGIIGDTIRILRDPAYGWKGEVYWIVVNPFFHIAKWRGVYKAIHVDLHNGADLTKHSLEAEIKRAKS